MPDGQTRAVYAGCDRCPWAGESAKEARRHHEATGHTTWAETRTLTFWGDPMEQWMAEEGMTRVVASGDKHPPA